MSIEDIPEASMALYAVSLKEGDTRAAEQHLAEAKMSPPRKLYYQILGNAAAGYREQVRALLEELRLTEPEMAARIQQQIASEGVLA